MPLTLPSNQSGVLSLSASQSISLGLENLLGGSAFTIAGWFQVPNVPQGPAVVLQVGQAFTLSFNNLVLCAQLGSAGVQTSKAVMAGRWYHVGVVYGNSTLQLFVNGALFSTATVNGAVSSNGSPVTVGGFCDCAVRRLSFWSEALEQPEVNALRFSDPSPYSGLLGAFDFAIVPAQDLSGNNLPITYQGGAAQSVVTPGLALNGSSFAQGNLGAADLSQLPFTIQTWVKFDAAPTSTEWIVSIGGPAGKTVGLTVGPNTGNPELGDAVILLQLGGNGMGFTLPLDTQGWTNLAATYDTATGEAIIYYNGVLRVRSGGPMEIGGEVSSAVCVGASSNQSQGFKGLVQNVYVWGAALTADEVEASLYPLSEGGDLPLALFDFTAARPLNLIAGDLLSLTGDATITHLHLPAAQVDPQAPAAIESKRRQTRAVREAPQAKKLAGFRAAPMIAPNAADFSPERVQEVVQALKAKLPGTLSPEQVEELRTSLSDAFAKARSGHVPLKGLVRSQLIGNEWVTFYNDGVREQAVYTKSAKTVDACMMWMIDMAATGIFGILSILDVPVTPNVVSKAIGRLFENSKVLKAIAKVLAETITASLCVDFVKSVYDENYLTSFVKDILSSLSWWDFLWMVSELLIELAALFFPAAELAILLAKLSLTVTQLIYTATQVPSNCPTMYLH